MRQATASDQPSGVRPLRQAAAWLVAILAALTAVTLLAFGLWAGFGAVDPLTARPDDRPGAGSGDGSVRTDGGTAPTAAGAPTARQPGFLQPETGDCLQVEVPSADGGVQVVPCAEAHHMEVVGLVDPAAVISGEPTQAEWLGLLEARCENLLQVHLGKLWDPQGQFRLRVAAPGPSEWLQGDRIGECLVVIRAGADGAVPIEGPANEDMPLFRGAVSDLDQARYYPQGRCLARAVVVGAPPIPVDCEGPHHFQVLEPLDLSARFDHAPDDTQWATLDEECAGRIQARFGGSSSGPSGNPLVGSTVRVSVRSWLAGSRASACLVGEVDAATGEVLERTSALIQ